MRYYRIEKVLSYNTTRLTMKEKKEMNYNTHPSIILARKSNIMFKTRSDGFPEIDFH